MNQETEKRIKIPDIKEFERLFCSNHQFLCMTAYKIVQDDFIAEDLVQEFFVKYWERREELHLSTSFEAFAYRSVKNSGIDYLRKQVVIGKKISRLALEELPVELVASDEIPENDKRLKRILELLNELPTERRRVFELHALQGMSYKEIGALLNISVNTVKTQLKRAYAKLREPILTLISFGFILFYFFF